MTRRTGKAGSTGQRVPNPFESTEDTSAEGADIAGPVPVYPVRRFRIEDGPAPQRAYGHVLTPRGWVREG